MGRRPGECWYCQRRRGNNVMMTILTAGTWMLGPAQIADSIGECTCDHSRAGRRRAKRARKAQRRSR